MLLRRNLFIHVNQERKSHAVNQSQANLSLNSPLPINFSDSKSVSIFDIK